jgi:hypothetical protein
MYESERRVDIALLAAALFLQRFQLGNLGIPLDLIAASLIFAHQFATGRLLIQYDRLLWFLLLGLITTSSLYFNFKSNMLASYGVFLTAYFFFTLMRPYSSDGYVKTLQGFQFLILILACLAILQFVAQFAIDGGEIIRFFGIIPDFLLQGMAIYDGPDAQMGAHAIIPITPGSSLIKSNGIFLSEPASMSVMAALGILIEVLEFRRPRYLILLVLGLLLSYSGSGVTILLVALPLAALVHTRAQLPALLVAFFALTLVGTEIIDASVFTSRIGEFEDVNASGFQRFTSSFWMVAEHFSTASLQALIRGNGPATMKEFVPLANYSVLGNTWFKLLYEYGLIGAFIFTGFLASCFRASWCPKPLMIGLIYSYVFGADHLISTSFLTIMVVLCTLSGPASRVGRVDEFGHSRASLVPGSGVE